MPDVIKITCEVIYLEVRNGFPVFQRLEENLKTVQDVVEALRKDSEVQEWVERIKGHPWVKLIEEETRNTGKS